MPYCRIAATLALVVLATTSEALPAAGRPRAAHVRRPLGPLTGSWQHDWSTAGAASWADFGYSLLTESQAAFVASTYKVASLEKCTGRASGLPTEEGIMRTAAQLKRHNPAVKVMFYWSTELAGLACYSANATFTAHPEWWLRDDHGNVVMSNSGPMLDWTSAAAREWWVGVPLGQPNASRLLDGILADGAGYATFPNITAARLDALYAGKLQMLQMLQDRFTALNGGVVFGNGLSEYDQDPTDPHNKDILQHAAGIQNEHYAVFEQVDAQTGALVLDKAANALANIEWATTFQNSTNLVFASFWPGPIVGFKNGWPVYSGGKQPTGNSSQVYAGWRENLQRYLEFNLASFLTVAGPNTYFTYAVWYELHQGFVPCPEAPDTCAAPPNWYPELAKPLGAPMGPRKQVGPYAWEREFEHALVHLDLSGDPYANTHITWN